MLDNQETVKVNKEVYIEKNGKNLDYDFEEADDERTWWEFE